MPETTLQPTPGRQPAIETAKIWMIHSVEAWESIAASGKCTDPALLDEQLRPAYDWISRKLRERVGDPPAGVQYPLWAWYQYQGADAPRPDLRHSAHLPPGTAGVRAELSVPRAELLLSDFELWHFVLNHSYLPTSASDDIRFEERLAQCRAAADDRPLIPEQEIQDQIESSWDRIFNLEINDPYLVSPGARRSVQAVLWQINPEQIVSEQRFIAR